jgi:hypothetical protein
MTSTDNDRLHFLFPGFEVLTAVVVKNIYILAYNSV